MALYDYYEKPQKVYSNLFQCYQDTGGSGAQPSTMCKAGAFLCCNHEDILYVHLNNSIVNILTL